MMDTGAIMAKEQELEKVLNAAYKVSTKKADFIKQLSLLSGVLAANPDMIFIKGYAACLKNQNKPGDMFLVSYSATLGPKHTFLIEDPIPFVNACKDMIEKRLNRVDSPFKVVVKMVALRMRQILELVDENNALLKDNSWMKYIERPVFDSSKAYSTWVNAEINWLRNKGNTKKYLEIINRKDIPEEAYLEAWDICQVDEVMSS